MSFHHQLERLRRAAAVRMPGCPPGMVTVDVQDLRELLHHFARIDAELRELHQQAAPLSAALADIAAERRRQVEQEGWTPEHDDKYRPYVLSGAAGCYAMHTLAYPAGDPPSAWPFAASWWKPSADTRRNLVKAGALIAAEIERIDRAAQKGGAA